MDKLNKDDLYEIEKIMDFYSATVADKIASYCHVAEKMEHNSMAGNLDKPIKETPLHPQIYALLDTQKRLKKIRDKLQSMRLKSDLISELSG